MKTRKERLSDRTCRLIEKGRGIYLKKKRPDYDDKTAYLGQHTCIQGGIDSAHWTYWAGCAMEIGDLEWAFGLAKLYNCKVVSRKIRKK